MSTSHITGLVLGLACGAAMQNYTRKQIWINSERVSQRLATITPTKPKDDGLLIPAALLPARDVLPIDYTNANDLILSAKADVIHRWNTMIRQAHAWTLHKLFEYEILGQRQTASMSQPTHEIHTTTTTVTTLAPLRVNAVSQQRQHEDDAPSDR